ncbi:hypothetical protein KRZ98_04280 [Sphingobium sp. AS12]|uniref:hypothetical protein n=1 Tax=Sphingobium sp. AS12 TaxID=2849495 RepID=UPI001C315D49|nr:hypothetical protein [Sphingobium sp. AS12]MBV2147503.1 hypothetical protein [Sphingobium sp. AS12]
MDEDERLIREKAERARRLAQSINDAKAERALLDAAEAYEAMLPKQDIPPTA